MVQRYVEPWVSFRALTVSQCLDLHVDQDFELLKSLGISVIINTTYNPNDPTRQPSDAAIMNHFADRGITYINYDLRDHMGETFIGPVMRWGLG